MVNARNPLSVRALLGTLNGLVGEVQATPTDNTLLARVKAIADALPGIGQKTAANSMSIIPASDMGTIAVSAASLPLPSGAATSAKQDTAKGVLDNIEAGIDELKAEIVLGARVTTTAALTVSASGDNTVIAAPGAGKHLAIYRLVMTAARGSEVDIILKSAATTKSGAMVADTYDLDFGDAPLICGTNEAFIVNLSAAVAVTGFVQYIEVAE
jgi:hypothetical protein